MCEHFLWVTTRFRTAALFFFSSLHKKSQTTQHPPPPLHNFLPLPAIQNNPAPCSTFSSPVIEPTPPTLTPPPPPPHLFVCCCLFVSPTTSVAAAVVTSLTHFHTHTRAPSNRLSIIPLPPPPLPPRLDVPHSPAPTPPPHSTSFHPPVGSCSTHPTLCLVFLLLVDSYSFCVLLDKNSLNQKIKTILYISIFF